MAKKRSTPTPVRSYKPMAEHYAQRVETIAQLVVDAMAAGDIEAAQRLYSKGVLAQRFLDHYRRISACIGDLENPLLLPKPEEKP